MAYGIKVIGKDTAANEYDVIDSTTTGTQSLGPAPNAGGLYTNGSSDLRTAISASQASPTAIQNFTSGDIVFARPADNVGQLNVNTIPSTPEFQVNGFYVNLRVAASLTSNVNGTVYGLQINNSAGTPITILDSRKISSTLEILKSYEADAFTGGKYADYDADDLADNLVWDGSSQTAAQFKNTYVSIQNSHCYTFTEDNTTGEVKVGSYYFDHSNQKIYYVGYFETEIDVPVGESITDFGKRPNLGNVLVGEFKA